MVIDCMGMKGNGNVKSHSRSSLMSSRNSAQPHHSGYKTPPQNNKKPRYR